MDDQARAIGSRVRYWRQRRNLTRQHFADLVGRSTSWLDKIEKGDRGLLRLPMLERVAEVLGIDPNALTDGPAAHRAAACVDGVEVQAIRAALGRYPCLLPADEGRPAVTLSQVARQLNYVEHAWASSHFTVVARHLPKLLRSAANHIVPVMIGTLPPERKVNHLLDLTDARIRTGRYRHAVDTVSEAERIAPEEVRCRPLAHTLLRSLLIATSGEPGRRVRQIALRAGVTA